MRGKTVVIERLPSRTLEKHFQKQVVDLARTYHWQVFHTFDSRLAIGTGYPDLCLVRQGNNRESARLIYAELKNERRKVTPEQQEWLDILATVPGVETYVWRPKDIEDIQLILR